MDGARCLQLGLGDTGGGGGGVHVGGGERGGGEVAVLAADGVGSGGAGDEETSEDGGGLGDGRHFDVVGVVGWGVVIEVVVVGVIVGGMSFVDGLVCEEEKTERVRDREMRLKRE